MIKHIYLKIFFKKKSKISLKKQVNELIIILIIHNLA